MSQVGILTKFREVIRLTELSVVWHPQNMSIFYLKWLNISSSLSNIKTISDYLHILYSAVKS